MISSLVVNLSQIIHILQVMSSNWLTDPQILYSFFPVCPTVHRVTMIRKIHNLHLYLPKQIQACLFVSAAPLLGFVFIFNHTFDKKLKPVKQLCRHDSFSRDLLNLLPYLLTFTAPTSCLCLVSLHWLTSTMFLLTLHFPQSPAWWHLYTEGLRCESHTRQVPSGRASGVKTHDKSTCATCSAAITPEHSDKLKALFVCFSVFPRPFFCSWLFSLYLLTLIAFFLSTRPFQSEADEVRGPRAGASQGSHPGTGGTGQITHLQQICVQHQSGWEESHPGWQRAHCGHRGHFGLSG